MNAIVFGEIKGRGQKSTACSEDIFVMEFYLPVLTLHLQWFILFIFCVLAPEGMNSIVFGKEMRNGTEGCGLFRCYFHYAEPSFKFH